MPKQRKIQHVRVYASSSNTLRPHYYEAASRLGAVLGRAGLDVVHGGGGPELAALASASR